MNEQAEQAPGGAVFAQAGLAAAQAAVSQAPPDPGPVPTPDESLEG